MLFVCSLIFERNKNTELGWILFLCTEKYVGHVTKCV
jgi:hypothetical protein